MYLYEFSKRFPHLNTVDTLEYCSIFGGVEEALHIKFFDNIYDTIEDNIIKHLDTFEAQIQPAVIKQQPYAHFLWACTKSDAKKINCFRKARISEKKGEELLHDLIEMGVLHLEESREPPLKTHPGQKLKKELRGYRIQPRIRFNKPFYRFYFRFIYGKSEEIAQGYTKNFFEKLSKNIDRYYSYPFEKAANALLAKRFDLEERGSYWDKDNEFDVFAKTSRGKLIVGECKYKDRKVCKNELTKLKHKCKISGLEPDYYLLASKSGFSKELEKNEDRDLILFSIEDFKELLYDR